MNDAVTSTKRRAVSVLGFSLLSLATLSSGCSKKSADHRLAASASPATRASSTTIQEPAVVAHGTRKLMNLDVPVYVDGAPQGVLRTGDLPALPEAHAWNGAKGFRMFDYLQAIGVKPESVRSIHLYANGNRIGSIEGTELRADKNKFVFSFSSGDTGTPLTRWNTDGMKNDFVVHEIRKVAVYVTKPAPAVDMKIQCIVSKAGACTDEIPYATSEMAKGTRIFVDGKIVGFVKRRQLTDSMIVGGKDENDRRYSIAKLVASLGLDPKDARGIELLAGDDVVARAEGKRWEGLRDSLYFTIPPHSHGKVRAHVPAEMQGSEKGTSDKDGLITAVHVYKSSNVSARELYPISEETDLSVQVATKDDAPQTN